MSLAPWRDDLWLAGRGLWRAKAFTVAAVLMLALGIAGTSVMFALVQGVLLRKLPVRDQDHLLVGWKRFPTGSFEHWPYRGAELDTIARDSHVLEGVAGVGYSGVAADVVVENGSASTIHTAAVTGAFFDVLGVAADLGRSLEPADDRSGAENVLVLTHAYWQGRYGGSRDVIGRRVEIKDQPFTIVGVMPPDLAYPRGVEGWMTVAACATTTSNPIFREALRNELDMLGRLRMGATPEQAESELRGLIARLEADTAPPGQRGLLPVLRSYESLVVGDAPGAILALFGAVGLVLLIASANVANLLLLRVQSRRSELALRAALGAGRARLAGQLLAESLLLACAAFVLGLALAQGTLRAVVALVPGGLPRGESVRVDPIVVLFTLGLALLVATLAGLAPALASARTDLVSQLRGGRGGTISSGAGRSRRALVVAQVALAVTVVAVAGLLTRSLLRLQTIDTGLSADRLVVVSLDLPQPKYAEPSRHRQLLDDLVARLEGAPGIDAATPVNALPFAGQGWDAPEFTAEGQDPEQARGNPSLNVEAIHPGHFRTLGVPLLRGRAFSDADRPGKVEVAIVSEDVAARAWPGADAIGKRLRIGGADSQDPWRTVVGVVKSTRYRELTDSRATLYLPAAQFIVSAQNLVLRSAAPLSHVASLARERVQALDPALRVMRVASFAEMREAPLARPRWNALLIGLFAVTALLLTAIGLYAVVGTSVRERASEIGVRLSLGATPADVRRLVLAEALRLAAAGAVLGLGGALAASRVVRGLLFGVHPLDPLSLLGATLLLVGAGVLAAWLPARRAARVDPAVALRTL